MDQTLCNEKHKRIEERLEIQDRRLNNHSERLDKIEQFQSRTEAQISSLCDQIKSLVTTMRWFIGLLAGAFVSFFFYAVQQGLLK
jgi:chromosome segregation ATPase